MTPRASQIVVAPWIVGETIYADDELQLLTLAANQLRKNMPINLRHRGLFDPAEWRNAIMGHGNKHRCGWDGRKGVSLHPRLEAMIQCGELVVEDDVARLRFTTRLLQTVVDGRSTRCNQLLVKCVATASVVHVFDFNAPGQPAQPEVHFKLKAKSKPTGGRSFLLRNTSQPVLPSEELAIAAD